MDIQLDQKLSSILLRQRSRPYLFSNTLTSVCILRKILFSKTIFFASAIVASAMKAIDLIENDTSLPGRVLDNAKYFRNEMQKLGFKVLI